MEIVIFVFLLLLLYAAFSKLIELDKFRMQVGQSPILTPFAGLISWSVPIVEILVALMLTSSRYRLAGLYAFFCLMTIFTTYIVAILTIGEFVPCSCGGVLERLSWTEHLILNISFVSLAIGVIVLHRQDAIRRVDDEVSTS